MTTFIRCLFHPLHQFISPLDRFTTESLKINTNKKSGVEKKDTSVNVTTSQNVLHHPCLIVQNSFQKKHYACIINLGYFKSSTTDHRYFIFGGNEKEGNDVRCGSSKIC